MNFLLIDAFSNDPFSGNPAGVCLSESIGSHQYLPDILIELSSESIVRSLEPDLNAIASQQTRGVIVTAKSDPGNDKADFVSRFFAPSAGIPEDPVTGSAHCCLAPYWAEKLGKIELTGYQASARGGYVRCRSDRDRVHLGGEAVTVLSGKLLV